jgi:hypothetical protein
MLISKIKKKGNIVHNKSTINLSLFSVILFFHFSINTETDNKSKNLPSSISVSPTISPIINNNPNIAPVYNSEFNQETTNYVYSLSYAVGMKIKDISIQWMEYIKEKATPKNFELLKQLIKKMVWKYRYPIVGSTAVGSYSVTSLLLLADYHYLHHKTVWTRWKSECSFEDLCAIPQKELARELLLAIGQHYYSEKNPIDLAHPLIQFLNTIDTEIRKIKRYITTTKIIKRLHLITIFPTNETKIAQAQRLLERTLFIKHIFLSWLSEYNLTSNHHN